MVLTHLSLIGCLFLAIAPRMVWAEGCENFLHEKVSRHVLTLGGGGYPAEEGILFHDLELPWDGDYLGHLNEVSQQAAKRAREENTDPHEALKAYSRELKVPAILNDHLWDSRLGPFGDLRIRELIEKLRDPSAQGLLEEFVSAAQRRIFFRANTQVAGALRRNFNWTDRLKKIDPELAEKHHDVDQLILRLYQSFPTSLKLIVALSMIHGKVIKAKLPDELRSKAPDLSDLGEISFNHFYLEHVLPHSAGVIHAAKFRSLETLMERAKTPHERVNVFKLMQTHSGTRPNVITSFSLFEEDIMVAARHLRVGRDFQRLTPMGSRVEMIRFKATINVGKGLESSPFAYEQAYIVGICAAPVGEFCRSKSQNYTRGEVVTFFPDCGPFVLQFPSLKRVRQRYLEGRNVHGFHLSRRLCEDL